MYNKILSTGFIMVACLFSTHFAWAASLELLDQDSNIPLLPTQRTAQQVDATIDLSQTFTVGITGRLTRVDLDLYRSDAYQDLRIDIRRTTSSGAPVANDSSALGIVTVPALAIPNNLLPPSTQWTSVDLSSFGIQVQAGELLAIVLQTNNPQFHGFNWRTANANDNPYAAGQEYVRYSDGTWYTSPSIDFSFRTYVTVPEPAAFVLLGLGAFGLFVWSRRRGRKAG